MKFSNLFFLQSWVGVISLRRLSSPLLEVPFRKTSFFFPVDPDCFQWSGQSFPKFSVSLERVQNVSQSSSQEQLFFFPLSLKLKSSKSIPGFSTPPPPPSPNSHVFSITTKQQQFATLIHTHTTPHIFETSNLISHTCLPACCPPAFFVPSFMCGSNCFSVPTTNVTVRWPFFFVSRQTERQVRGGQVLPRQEVHNARSLQRLRVIYSRQSGSRLARPSN